MATKKSTWVIIIIVIVILGIIGCLGDDGSSDSSSSSSTHACAMCGRTSGVSYRKIITRDGYTMGPNYYCYKCVEKYSNKNLF